MNYGKPGERHKVVLNTPFSAPVKAILHSLVNHMDGETGECWPGKQTLAREAGVSKTTAHDAIRTLRALGLVTVEYRRNERRGGNTSNLYTVKLAALAGFRAESLPLDSKHVSALAPDVKADTGTLSGALEWWRGNFQRLRASGMPRAYGERRPILARWASDPEAVDVLSDAYGMNPDKAGPNDGWRRAKSYLRLLLDAAKLDPYGSPKWWESPETARPFLRLALAAITWASVGAARHSGKADRTADLWKTWELGPWPTRPKLPEETEAERQEAARLEAEHKAAGELERRVRAPGFIPSTGPELVAWRKTLRLSQGALAKSMKSAISDCPAQPTLSKIERGLAPFPADLGDKLRAWIDSNPPELVDPDGAPPVPGAGPVAEA